MITTVNTADALIAALRSAHAGDTVLLAAGTYNAVALANLNFSSAVTIQSADPSHQAVITNLSVSGSSGLAFNQLHFATAVGTAATVGNSHAISFSGDTFQGATAGVGNAMMIRSSDTVTVTGSDFGQLGTGINELSSNNVTISNNTFHDITSGAIRGTGVTNETISGNTFADAKATVADHSDVIGLWQDNTANHVAITGNTFGSGSSASTTPVGSAGTGSTAHSTTVTVSTTADLVSAVQHAHAGDTILVAAGAYNGVALNNLHFSSDVTIQSADATHQAVINNLSVSGSSGLAFNQLHFATSADTAATVSGSNSISFSGDTFQGATAGVGNAMMIRSSDTVTVTGSDFGQFGTGINELTSNNVTISNNAFHEITAGAVRGTGVTNETISGNTFADAKATVADHSDVIGLWQDNTANHVAITGNTFGTGSSATTTPVAPATPAAPGTSASTGSDSTASGPTTVTVGSVTELQSALQHAHGGDTILLKAGTYDGVGISNLNFSSTVTIASADTAHEAVINNLAVGSSSNLAFENLNVELTGRGSYAVSVSNASHVSLDGLTVHGASSSAGVGVWVRNSNDVSVTNSEITNLNTGVGHLDDSGLTISNNNLHDIGTDGVMGGGSSHVVVSGNTFTDFHPPVGAHPDAIQFFSGSTGTHGSDILVSDNVITRGSGDVIQGIFVESTDNISIVDNAMAGTMYNGIGLSTTSNALIQNNFVEGFSDMGTRIIVRGGSSDVSVVGNTTQSVVNYVDGGVENPNFLSSGNTIISGAAVGDLTALKAWLSLHTGVTASLTGGYGDDIITGSVGADNMSGGIGDDTYIVNNAGDVVNEAAFAGLDTVKSSLSTYSLGANVENLVLTGTTAQTGIGNSLDNVLTSNGVQASLNGGAGNDTLIAIGNADTLTGGAGSDVFSIGKVPTSPVQITDFTSGQDKLDLHTLLANYHGTNPVADNWVQFQSSSTGVSVLVDVDGPSGSAGFVTVAKLAGVTSLSSSDWVFH